jgi:Protein of unknown function (DUF3667)
VTVATGAPPVCHNCGVVLEGPFCSGCGQKSAPLNPTLHDLVHEFTHEMLHVDGRIFRSVQKLLLEPGFLTREHFAGRKARWISPIRLYLVFSVIYFGLAALTEPTGTIKVDFTGSDEETAEQLQRLGFKSERELEDAVSHAQAKWAPRLMFVLVPLFAWLVQVACRRRGRNYPQHLYFALHVHAAVFAAGAVAALAQLIEVPALATTLQILALLYGLWYFVRALRTAYDLPLRGAILRGATVAAVYFVAIALGVAAIVVPLVFGTLWISD